MPRLTSLCDRISFTASSLYSSAEASWMASSPSSLISECESFRSKRARTSLMACSMALRTSCMSTLLTMSKELSAAITLLSTSDYSHKPLTSVCHARCDTEKSVKVFRGMGSYFVSRQVADFGELFGDSGDPGRLVALAAIGHRSEEWGVGFDQHAVERDLHGDIADGLRFRECDVAGKGDKEAAVHGAPGVVPFAGEAVQDAAEAFGRPFGFDHVERVVPCVGAVVRGATVDDDGLLVGGGDFHLLAEDGFLHLSRGVVVEVVETDFAAGDDFWFLQ